MEKYLLAKSLHIFGVVLFLGNIVVTALWKLLAERTRNPAIVAFSQRLVTITDFAFTAIGAALIFVTGRYFLANKFGEINTISWLSWGYWLFIVSGLLWIVVLVPVQIKQAKLAKEFENKDEIPNRYWTLSKIWVIVGFVATILPLANLYFMVFKPT
ncbi:MAG: DUF2269 domain-containing protein [Leptospirales bacterium]